MITHSLIAGALISISLAVTAGAIAVDGMSAAIEPSDAAATVSAVLHKDMANQQGGYADMEVTHVARAGDGCAKQGTCAVLSPVQAQIKSIKKVDDLLALDDESSAASALIAMLVIVGSLMLYTFHRSPSMK